MGMTFGKYTLLDRIAVGGMAEIFLAKQAGLAGFEKTLAIKRIRPHLSKQKNFIKMFLHEAKLAAQLNHANIVQIYDLGRISDSYFIAMEYIFGRDMRVTVPYAEEKGIMFPVEYALKIASSSCEALYYAHRKTDAYGNNLGIVHRDVTPENIMVSFDGNVKVVDFGIAKAASQLEDTKAGEIKGKLCYMSPEQCRGEKLDQRSDIFALGIVLYEWLTGYKLFGGEGKENEMAILQSIINPKIYPPSYFREDIPEEVERIIMKSLKPNVEDRYQNAWDMQFDLDTFLASHDFTPSNIHLSNFMKQLFKDEMEKDREKLMVLSEAKAASGVVELGPDDVELEVEGRDLNDSIEELELDDLEVIEEASLSSDDNYDKILKLGLSLDQFEVLQIVAKRKRIPINVLVRDILNNVIKYVN